MTAQKRFKEEMHDRIDESSNDARSSYRYENSYDVRSSYRYKDNQFYENV